MHCSSSDDVCRSHVSSVISGSLDPTPRLRSEPVAFELFEDAKQDFSSEEDEDNSQRTDLIADAVQDVDNRPQPVSSSPGMYTNPGDTAGHLLQSTIAYVTPNTLNTTRLFPVKFSSHSHSLKRGCVWLSQYIHTSQRAMSTTTYHV